MPAVSTSTTFVAALLRSSSLSSPHSITTRTALPLNFPDALLRLRPPGGRWGWRRRKVGVVVLSKPSSAELSAAAEEWIKKLPDKKKPLYAHSLPCIEAWLKKLGFHESREDRAVWLVEKPDWHAQLSLDITDLYIRYLKSGPGNLEKDVERRFSYALSREDIENAILGGP